MTLDMTKGTPWKLLLRFALPLMISSLLQQLYTMCDSIIVGRLLGSEAFAAIGSASNLNWFPLSMISGAAIGFGVALAQRFGAKDEEGLRHFFASSILLIMLLGFLLTIVGTLTVRPFLQLLRTPTELLEYACRYLRVLWAGLFITAALNILTSALRAVGDSRTPFVALVVSSIINILSDFVLIQHLHMGVKGAAAATVLSQAVAVVWCLHAIICKTSILPQRRHWKPQKPVVKELLRLGIPHLLCQSVTASGELWIQSAVNAYGALYVTGVTAARRHFNLLYVVDNGLEGALATFTGQNWGANEKKRIIHGTRTAVAMGIGSSVATAVLVCLFAEQLIRFYIPHSSVETIGIGTAALRVEAIFLPFLYLLCEYRAAIQGMGNALLPMLSGFLELLMRLLCAWLLPVAAGRSGLYFTDGLTWLVTMLMLLICYQVLRKKHLTV